MKKTLIISLVVLAAVLFSGFVMAAERVVLAPGEIMWKAGPASLPPGSEVVVIEGDPKSTGLFTMRLKLPPGAMIAPHTHSSDESVTVLSGTIYVGVGGMMDKAGAKALSAGGFFSIPKGEPMYVFTDKEGVELQLTAFGPWDINYIGQEDKPMK